MKQNGKKILAMILTICMILTAIPSAVFAVKAADSSAAGSKNAVVDEKTGVRYEWYQDISKYRSKTGMYYENVPEKADYVFGGWFTDSKDTSEAVTGTTGGAWAKFVPEETLAVKAQINTSLNGVDLTSKDLNAVNLRLVTSVDSLKYNKVGFEIAMDGKQPVDYPMEEVYKTIQVREDEGNLKDKFVDASSVFGKAAARFSTLRITTIPNTNLEFTTLDICVTPYWITKDGSRVEGMVRSNLLISDELANYDNGVDFTKTEHSYTYKTEQSENTTSYQYFKESSDTVYLKGTYTTTGSRGNTFGIAIRNGGETRQVYFDGKGVKVYANESITEAALTYNKVTFESNGVYVWSKTGTGDWPPYKGDVNQPTYYDVDYSTVQAMLADTEPKAHEVIWAIEENVLYCSVDSQIVLRMPMEKMCDAWTAGRYYQVGIAAYNTSAQTTALKYDIQSLQFGKAAYGTKEQPLLISEAQQLFTTNMEYEPISGSYVPATITGTTYAYGTPVKSDTEAAISVDVSWMDLARSGGRAGISVKSGDSQSAQLYIAPSTVPECTYSIFKQLNHGYGTPVKITNFSAAAFDEEKVCNIKAFVYDGKVFILLNDVTAYETSLTDLFGGVYEETNDITLGIATWDSTYGQSKFSNIEFYSGQKAVKMKTDSWTFHPNGTDKNLTTDTKTGSINASSTPAQKQIGISGVSDVWQITGTMTHGDGAANMQGFQISDEAGHYVRLLGNNYFVTVNGNDTAGAWNDAFEYNSKVTKYAFQSDPYFNATTADSVEFQAMIVDDVFFLWLDEKLSWMIPLEEFDFGGFAEGTKYQMQFRFAENQMEAQAFTNLKVKTGSEVDETLVQTLRSCQHFNWIGGTESQRKGLTPDGVIYPLQVRGWASYVQSETKSDTVWLSGTWKTLQDKAWLYGVTISDGTNNRQVRFSGEGINVRKDEEDYTPDECTQDAYKNIKVDSDSYVWAQRKTDNAGNGLNSAVYNMTMGKAGSHKIIWAIQNNILYCSVNGFTSVVLPLEKICSAWTASADVQYQIGFSEWQQQYNGQVHVSDIELLFGEEAEEKLVSDVNANLIVDADTSMVYDPIAGVYMPRIRSGKATVYGKASTSAQVEADLCWKDRSKTGSSAGISVKQGNHSVQVYVYGTNGNVFIKVNEGWNAPSTTFVELKGAAAGDTCHIKADVQNNRLTVSYNGVQKVSIALADYITGYQADKEVQLGFVTWDAHLGLATFKNVQFLNRVQLSVGSVWSATQGHLTYNEAKGTITRTNTNEATVFFTGASKTWEVIGKMKQEDLSTLIRQGFVVKARTNGARKTYTKKPSTEEWVSSTNEIVETKFLGQQDGFVVRGPLLNNEDRTSTSTNHDYCSIKGNRGSAGKSSNYVLNENAKQFFLASTTEQREKTEVNFRLVIANDTLCLWLDDVLSWRIPLCAYTFGSYEAGSDYQLGVVFNPVEEGTASFENLVVKYGTEADVSGMPRFAVAEENAEYHDAVAGTIERRTKGTTQKIVFAGTESEARARKWEVSGTLYIKNRTENVLMGFQVGNGTKSKIFYGSNQGFVENGSWSYKYNMLTHTDGAAGAANQYIFNADTEKFFGGSKTLKELPFKAVITDDILYVYFDEVLSWKIPLTNSYFGNFSENSFYSVGIVFSGDNPGIVGVRDVKVKSGNEVLTNDNFYIRDTYVLAEDGTYYLYGSRFSGSVDVFTSRDLLSWEKNSTCFVPQKTSWMSGQELWAPEVHEYKGSYYMFTSVQGTYNNQFVERGVVILKSDSPCGPFVEWSDGPVSPTGMRCLDGTLYVEDGKPYMVFSRELNDSTMSERNGEMYYIQLTDNLKASTGSATKLFDAKSGAALPDGLTGYITDGPQLYKAEDGTLLLLWSTFTDGDNTTKTGRYLQMQLRSKNGKLSGLVGAQYDSSLPLLYGNGNEDGGHGMIFNGFDGKQYLALHTPNFYGVTATRTERLEVLTVRYDATNRYLTTK